MAGHPVGGVPSPRHPCGVRETGRPSDLLVIFGVGAQYRGHGVALTAGKLEALQVLIQSWLGSRACSKRDLESLIGSLSHGCCVVRAGKTFLRRLFELLAVAHRSDHWV